jgi:hypothetical protein
MNIRCRSMCKRGLAEFQVPLDTYIVSILKVEWPPVQLNSVPLSNVVLVLEATFETKFF